MTFINAKITKEDYTTYDLYEMDEKFLKYYSRSSDWTIDKQRNVYLRDIWHSNRGREPEPNPEYIQRIYHFYIDGDLYQISLSNDMKKSIFSRELLKSVFTIYEIKCLINGSDDFSPFIHLFYEALFARKGNGIRSEWVTNYDLTLIYNDQEIKHL